MRKILHYKQMVITVHGNREEGVPDRFVPAEVLQSKLANFLSALKEVDHSVTGQTGREYFVSHLKTGSAELGFRETQLDAAPSVSAFEAFHTCACAVSDGDATRVAKYNGAVQKLEKFGAGAGKKFSHITVALENASPLRVDAFFVKQAKQIIKEREETTFTTPYFKGASEESFDGVVKEVDLRGRAPLCKLILSGSGNQIDCVFRDFSVDEIKDVLNRRAWVEGKAIYDGFSGLPVRFEINNYREISAGGDPERWRGAVTKLGNDDWTEFEGQLQ